MVRLYRSLQPELNRSQLSACHATVEIPATMTFAISDKSAYPYAVTTRPQGFLANAMPPALNAVSMLRTGGFRIAESGLDRGRSGNGGAETLVASWFNGMDQKQQHITTREPVPRFGKRRDRPKAS